MQFLDKTCFTIFNKIFKLMKYTCFPFRLLCKIITRFFERPYSFFFMLDFFVLITPSLLLIEMLIQYSDYVNSTGKLNFIFYAVLMNLIMNFISVFYIYEVYGRHTLDEVKRSFTVSTFMKYTIEFLFHETRLGYIAIYYILQVIFYFISLSFLCNESDLNSVKFEYPVLIVFIKFATICGLIFTLFHIIMYVVLFMVLLCAINNSCLFRLCVTNHAVENSSGSNKKQAEIKSNHNSNYVEKDKTFFITILDCYRFFGLYDYKIFLEIDCLRTGKVFDMRNDVL